jgi:hypothetical protein
MPRRLLSFVLLGLFFATPGEILNQILARHDVSAFRATLTSYTMLLIVGYFVAGRLDRWIKRRAVSVAACYLALGSLGLAVEWFLLGNAPVADPFQVVTQTGMFTYWGTLLLGPRLVLEPAGAHRLRRSFVTFFVVFSALYLLVALVIPRDRGGIFLGFVGFAAGTAALNYFYIKYIRALAAADAAETT